MNRHTHDWTLKNGKVLLENRFRDVSLSFHNGLITQASNGNASEFDASDLLIVPGIVDVHGDGFERNISPRASVSFDLDTALLETDRQLICNGITTAYLAMTISWEPGLRSLAMAIDIVEAMKRLQGQFISDMRLQLRWEVVAIEAVPYVAEWLRTLPSPTLAINDHFTQLLSSNKAHKVPEYALRAGLAEQDYRQQMQQAIDRPTEIAEATRALIDEAKKAGVSVFSHDEPSVEVRQANRAMGMHVCEFPLTEETASEAQANHEPVILGAPNVVRGGSHIGALDATTAINSSLCNVLASDYYYPSLFNAALKLGKHNENDLATHWPIVSTNPARAVQLNDRGQLNDGFKADALALSRESGTTRIEAVFVSGQPVFVADSSRLVH